MYFDLRARALSWVEISKQKNLIKGSFVTKLDELFVFSQPALRRADFLLADRGSFVLAQVNAG